MKKYFVFLFLSACSVSVETQVKSNKIIDDLSFQYCIEHNSFRLRPHEFCQKELERDSL